MFSRFLSLLLSSFFFFLLNSVSSTEFIFNSFNSTALLLYGSAAVKNSLLSLTNESTFSIGRALYPSKVPTRSPNSTHLLPFSSSFIFSIPSYKNRLPGHGFAFLFAPAAGIDGVSSAQHLGLFNFTNDGSTTNHVFAIEFDVFENQEFNDIDDNHVGVDVNSLTSVTSHGAGYWIGDDDDNDFKELKLNNGENYQVWIDYTDSRINVTMERAGRKRPDRPLISAVVNLSDVLLDEMYIGFGSATGQLVEGHVILSWSFSHSNFSMGDALKTTNLPSFDLPKGSVLGSKVFVLGISIGSTFLLVGLVVFLYFAFLLRKRKKMAMGEEIQEWEMEYWPHRIPYKEIHKATDGFSEKNVIGTGAHGKVYKGVMAGGAEIAVKSIINPHENQQGMKAFLSEISTLGRLKHRSLVGIKGWCTTEKGSLILVYEYMENGSLDKRIFRQYPESTMLNWEERVQVLKKISHGILYLHDGWEFKVLHRDIKASNVLLDKDMNPKLGDFGLARMNHSGDLLNTTKVVGTLGYMAPELLKTGRATVRTDVFGFGVMVLEVVCGREPIMQDKQGGLVDWVWRLMQRGELVSALDERVKGRGGYREEEVERVLQIGLLCAHPEPRRRPAMRQVVKALEEEEGKDWGEDEEGMKVSLLHSAEWSKRYISHPTFDDIQKGLLSSASLSGSDFIVEGR